MGIPRYEGPEVDPTIVTHDAKDLYRAGEKRLGTDEKTFIRVFTERSWAHVAAVASAYHHMYDRKLEKVNSSFQFPFPINICVSLEIYHRLSFIYCI